MRKIIYLDQVIGPVSIDILNEFAGCNTSVELYYGQSYKTYADLSETIRVHKKNKYHRESFGKRLFSWTLFFTRTLTSLIFRKKDFELFIVTNPPLNIFTGLFMNRIFGIPFYLLIFDIYPDAIVQYNYLKESNPVIRLWKYLMKKSMLRAEKIFTISRVMKDLLQKYNSGNKDILVINNWVDNSRIRPVPKIENPFAKEYGLLDKKVVLYSGNFGKTHDLESLVEAARLLSTEKEIHFLIIGDGEKKKKLTDLIKNDSLQNVTLLPFQPEDVFPYSLSTGDLAVVSLGMEAGSLSVPSKTYYMMAAGCAVIALASGDSELAEIVRTHDIGLISAPGNPGKLAENIRRILKDPRELEACKKRSREASALYSSDNATIFVNEIGL